jgi:hypothetical protein
MQAITLPQPKSSQLPKGLEPSYPRHLALSAADNCVLFIQIMQKASCTGKDALTIILQRHELLHHLYESSVLLLVASTQSAALGIKSAFSDVIPPDWAALSGTSSSVWQEHLKDYEKEFEPSDRVLLGTEAPPFDGWTGNSLPPRNRRCNRCCTLHCICSNCALQGIGIID